MAGILGTEVKPNSGRVGGALVISQSFPCAGLLPAWDWVLVTASYSGHVRS